MCATCVPTRKGRPVSNGNGSRMLLLKCPACTGIKIRAAFSRVARWGYPTCACGFVYTFACPDAHVRYCEQRQADESEYLRHPLIRDDQSRRDRSTIRAARKVNGSQRFQCGGCSSFLKLPNQLCRCGYSNDWRRLPGGGSRDQGHYGPGGVIVDDIPF